MTDHVNTPLNRSQPINSTPENSKERRPEARESGSLHLAPLVPPAGWLSSLAFLFWASARPLVALTATVVSYRVWSQILHTLPSKSLTITDAPLWAQEGRQFWGARHCSLSHGGSCQTWMALLPNIVMQGRRPGRFEWAEPIFQRGETLLHLISKNKRREQNPHHKVNAQTCIIK